MFFLTKAAVPHMPAGSAIINTASINSDTPNPTLLAYATTKGAMQNFTARLAQPLAEKGIRANAVAPGLVLTRAISEDSPIREWALKSTRSPRLGAPEDIASAVAFLMSADGEWINGQVLSVDGGATLR